MNETAPPWTRAGGYTRGDWLKCLRLAAKRHVEAANARSRYMEQLRELAPETLRELDRLKTADEEATRVWRGVLEGDAECVGDLIGEVWAGDERQPDGDKPPK